MLQPLRRLRDRIRARDADGVEAVAVRGAHKRSFQRGPIAQKSRSA
jgi:hypothetical protein